MEKYNEILRLKEMLTQHQIPFDFSEFHGGYHICYPNKDNVICSVIEHDGSYGRKEDKDLIQQLAKCSDKIKELEQKIAKKKKKISKLKSKNSYFEDTINNLVSENKYLNDKHKTIEASCIEASKSTNIIKEILNKQNIDSETKLSEIRKTLS